MDIPKHVIEMIMEVILTASVMFINQIPFVIITYGWKICLIMVEWVPHWTAKQLAVNLTKVLQIYSWVGFNVQTKIIDMKFKK